MKRIFYLIIVCTVQLIVSCTGNNTSGRGSDADSIYKWENIRQYLMEQPEHALALVDTAEMRGLADANYANWMRATVQYNSPKLGDMEKVRALCQQILDNQAPAADSTMCQKTISLMMLSYINPPINYQEAIRYAIKGAEMAHHLGRKLAEADFYFEAGKVMEHIQPGSGLDYMYRSLNIYREAARDSIQPLPNLSYNLGSIARFQATTGKYAEAVQLLQERLQVMTRIEREYATAPAGWIDQQRAYTYSVLAYCQHRAGDKAGARRTAEAFELTKAGQLPDNQNDIMNYYVLAGNAERIQQIYNRLEPYIREHEDTISQGYAGLLQMYADGLNTIGRHREAFQELSRHQVINDSLLQRERQSETLKYAQQLKTQEKELQLKDEEMKTTIYRILSFSLVAITIVILFALWRLALAHRRVLIKNRELYDMIVREQRREESDIQRLENQPEQERTPGEQLYLRIVALMNKEKPYTDTDLNRDSLAAMLATNHRYIDDAIRECSDNLSTNAFINSYRIEHAARLLTDTNDSISLIAELSGFANRTTFNEQFRNRYKMTPSEYRKAAKS